jgi:predicted metalloprotease with PDZ domain
VKAMPAVARHRRRSSSGPPAAPPALSIRYQVEMPEPASHELVVTMEVPAAPDRTLLRFGMPAWAPGSYMIRDFARHIYDLEVTDGRGRPLATERLDKQRWEVAAAGQAVRIRYRVFAFEESVRTSFFDDRHAYWNGTSLFCYVEGELDRPCEVTVRPRPGWRVSTALPAARGRRGEANASVYLAAGYDELADSPFEVGTHALHAFSVGGARFEVALFGRSNADVPRLLRDLRRIVGAAAELFGGFPFERYLFIVHGLAARGGGLEHAASTTLDIAGLGFEDDKAYQRFAELAAHEFFHTWNVKRIRDRVLGPFDYQRETYTRLLWFHEGFTEYMESILLLRAGVIDAATYLDDLAEDWPKYASRPGRNVTPLAELSFEAWIKLYKPADNHTNRTVSYYEKGKWAALVLEVLLREATGGRRGVEDLFRRLWAEHRRHGQGLGEADIEAAVAAIAGRPLGAYFARYIRGNDELPVLALLRRAGVAVDSRPPWQDEEDVTKARRCRGYTGITWAAGPGAPANERALIRNVVPGSPAFAAGLSYGDDVAAVGGQRVTAVTAPRRFADHAPGDRIEVHFFRRDTLRAVTLTLGTNPERRLALATDEHATPAQRAVRRGWLGV